LDRDPRLALPIGERADARQIVLGLGDAEVARALVLEIGVQALVEICPQRERLEREWHLRQRPTLLSHPSRVHAGGLAADPAALEEEDVGAPLGEKVGTGRADDPTANDRDVTSGTGQEEPEVFMGGSTDRR